MINILVKVLCAFLIGFFVWFGLDPAEMQAKKQDKTWLKQAELTVGGNRVEADQVRLYQLSLDKKAACFVPASKFEKRKAVIEEQVYTLMANQLEVTNTCDAKSVNWNDKVCLICKL